MASPIASAELPLNGIQFQPVDFIDQTGHATFHRASFLEKRLPTSHHAQRMPATSTSPNSSRNESWRSFMECTESESIHSRLRFFDGGRLNLCTPNHGLD